MSGELAAAGNAQACLLTCMALLLHAHALGWCSTVTINLPLEVAIPTGKGASEKTQPNQ
jgi:hypothetical protein